MAAAESSTPSYILILVAILPVILSPLLAWVLSRSPISKEAATIDYLNKRLDILERLTKLHTQLAEGPIKPFLDTEIEHCRAFLHQPPTFIPHGAEAAAAAPQSRWVRFFVTQPTGSRRKRIFKVLFYVFFAIAMFGPASVMITWFLTTAGDIHRPTLLALGVYFGSFVFYFVLALLFRLAALPEQPRNR